MGAIEAEVIRLRARLTVNQCHLSDVRDARAQLSREWESLQEERTQILEEIAEFGIPADQALWSES